ncbi:hypothetical protein ACJMK2_033440 [Sinanodonta woodiana]|uniref:Peptidase S1 domain-containing protein n=1 Tax=Sinanodonta woodiana TaxID=1069815 RepID=A0ABD3WND9_SINWO
MNLFVVCALVGLVAGKPHSHKGNGNRPVSGEAVVNNYPTCGVSTYEDLISHYIVGGQQATPNEWPWQVLLKKGTSSLTCGGSLVVGRDGTLKVLTAAHCTVGSRASQWTVVMGAHHLTSTHSTNTHWFQTTVSAIVQHANYNSNTLENDVSIMILSQQPPLKPEIQPVCLAKSTYSVGETCWVTGWGTTTYGGSISPTLQEVQKSLVSVADCRAAYGQADITDGMLCGGKVGIDACQGDSGGPLVCKRGSSYELVGVVSWGYGCGFEGYPGVYANVHYYSSWLSANL